MTVNLTGVLARLRGPWAADDPTSDLSWLDRADGRHTRRYAQCDETCTADCGHCKGRRFGPYALTDADLPAMDASLPDPAEDQSYRRPVWLRRLRRAEPYAYLLPVVAGLAWLWATETYALALLATGYAIAGGVAVLIARGVEIARERGHFWLELTECDREYEDLWRLAYDVAVAPTRSTQERAAARALRAHVLAAGEPAGVSAEGVAA